MHCRRWDVWSGEDSCSRKGGCCNGFFDYSNYEILRLLSITGGNLASSLSQTQPSWLYSHGEMRWWAKKEPLWQHSGTNPNWIADDEPLFKSCWIANRESPQLSSRWREWANEAILLIFSTSLATVFPLFLYHSLCSGKQRGGQDPAVHQRLQDEQSIEQERR